MLYLVIGIPILLWAVFHRLKGGTTCNKNPEWLWVIVAVFIIPLTVGCEPSYYQTLVEQDIPTDNAWDCPSCFWDNEEWNWKGYEECYMYNGREIIFGCWHEELGTKDVSGWDEWRGKPPHPSWMEDNERNAKNPDGSYKYADGYRYNWMPSEARLLDVYKQYTVVYPDSNYPDDAARRRLEQQDKIMDMAGHYMDRENRDDLTISDSYENPHFFYYPRKFNRDPLEYGPFGSDNDSMYYRSNHYDKNWYFMRRDASVCVWVNGDSVLSDCWHDERDFCKDPYGYDFPFKYLDCPDSTLAWDEWPGHGPSAQWLRDNRVNTRLSDGSLMYPDGLVDYSGKYFAPGIKSRTENRSNHTATEW